MDAKESWTRYWKTGQTHSCFAGGQPFDNRPVWAGFLDSLPAKARILDLACGAGALTRLAAAHSGEYAVTGVDYADGLPEISGAVMHEGVALEALPFADAGFDAVISQFGLEYADTGRAVPEAARVLRNGGRFAVLAHAADGEAVAAARNRVSRVAGLISEDGPVVLTRAYGHALEKGGAEPARLERIISKFHAEAAKPQDETTQWALGYLSEIISKHLQFPPPYLYENAQTLLDELTGYVSRLERMDEAAFDSDGIAGLAELARAAGLEPEEPVSVSDAQGKPVGWWLSAIKS